MKMKRLSLLALPALLFSTSAIAEVDPKIHKLCIEAKDYAGCVRVMKGEAMPTSRQINSQGADIAEGNSCPEGFAYIGGGNCQEVRCEYNSSGFNPLGRDSLVAGLKDYKGNDVWSCKYDFWVGAGVLRLTGGILRTSQNNDCPPGEPTKGFMNTCQTASDDWFNSVAAAAKAEKEGPRCDFRLKKYACSYDSYLEANPAMKQWAELNPGMASKERLRLQSVD